MAPDSVRLAGMELDYPMIDGALDLMALANGNNLDQETIRKAGQLKRRVAQRSKDDDSWRRREVRIKVTVPKKSGCKGNPKRKIRRLDDQTVACASGAEPGPSSAAISTGETRPPSRPWTLPAGIQDLVGLCSMPIQKQITATDVNHGQCRLMLPRPAVIKQGLLDMLNPDYENIKQGIPVTVYGPDGREYAMIFKLWTGKSPVLKSLGWKLFCRDYGLRFLINMATLTIWMFRRRQTNDLCFAITW